MSTVGVVPQSGTHNATTWSHIRRLVLGVFCAACRVEMPREEWPSHYRTKRHRAALKEPTDDER